MVRPRQQLPAAARVCLRARARPARPAALLLPATQLARAQLGPHLLAGRVLVRARSSAAHSLFNRLDGLVLELQLNKDFFARWPQRLCQRIARRKSMGAPNATECWNGRDFGG